MENKTIALPIINIPGLTTEPMPPSVFEQGVADQLKGLAEMLEAGTVHITHFALTVKDDKQRMEIEVE